MSEISERDAQILNTGRLLRAEADLIIPMLDERREHAIAKMLLYYRAGELTGLPQAAAELCVVEDLKQNIKNKIKAAEAVERRNT